MTSKIYIIFTHISEKRTGSRMRFWLVDRMRQLLPSGAAFYRDHSQSCLSRIIRRICIVSQIDTPTHTHKPAFSNPFSLLWWRSSPVERLTLFLRNSHVADLYQSTKSLPQSAAGTIREHDYRFVQRHLKHCRIINPAFIRI